LIQKLFYSTKYVFIENAILLRFKLLKFICFPIISVISNNKADLIKRIINRDKCDRATAEKILENQMNLEEFISQSEYVVFNDEGKDRLEEEVDEIMKVIS
jgi:dephospho-CoA kinase